MVSDKRKEELRGIVRFMCKAVALKDVRRTGWNMCVDAHPLVQFAFWVAALMQRIGEAVAERCFLFAQTYLGEKADEYSPIRYVPYPESTAAHSWSLATFVELVARGRPDLDAPERVVVALTHDQGEIGPGDVVTIHLRGIERERRRQAKFQQERRAMLDACSELPESIGWPWYLRWAQYERRVYAIDQFISEADTVEAVLQALVYRRKGRRVDPLEWLMHARLKVKDEELVVVLDILEEETK